MSTVLGLIGYGGGLLWIGYRIGCGKFLRRDQR